MSFKSSERKITVPDTEDMNLSRKILMEIVFTKKIYLKHFVINI